MVKILSSNHDPLYHTLTDTQGNYSINEIDPSSEYHLIVTRDGYLLNRISIFSITAGQNIDIDGTITPDPNADLSTIVGHLFDDEGNPLANANSSLLKVVGSEESQFLLLLQTNTDNLHFLMWNLEIIF